MNVKIILVGGFSEMIELCENNDITIVGIIDRTGGEKIMGYPVLGTDEEAKRIYEEYKEVPVVISPDLPKIRRKLVHYYQQIGFRFQSLVSRKAIISRYASIGEGVIIHDGAHVSAMAAISSFVRINVYGNVMHDCSIGQFSTIAPNSVLLGHVKIGEEVYVGANATLLPNVGVGDKAVIGAGAVVTKDVISGQTVKGVPAK